MDLFRNLKHDRRIGVFAAILICLGCVSAMPAHSSNSLRTSKSGNQTADWPDWWNTSGNDLYIGISVPCQECELAKYQAIINAVNMYVNEKGSFVNYRMEGKIKSTVSSDQIVDDFQFKQDYGAVAKSFSLEILREHYNDNGEYFVLCSIRPDSTSKNLFHKQWSYTTDETGNSRIRSIAGLRLNEKGAWHIMQYLFDVNADSGTTHRIISVNKNPIWTSKKPMPETRSDFFDGSDLPIGAEQTRALSSLPLLPDSITVVQNTRGHWLYDDWLERVSLDSRSAGVSNPMHVKFVLLDNHRLQSNIVERFPDVIEGYDDLKDKKFKEKHGFSLKYLASKETIERETINGLGIYESPFWEIAKNNGLLMALSEAMSYFSSIIKGTIKEQNEEAVVDGYCNYVTTRFAIYPLYYMDSSLLNAKYLQTNEPDILQLKQNINRNVELILIPSEE